MSLTSVADDEQLQQQHKNIIPKIGKGFIGIAMRLLLDIVVNKVQHMRDARLGNDMAPPSSPPKLNAIYYTLTKIITQSRDNIKFPSLKSWIT